ncbi:universal stress protein [Cohnella pontilimi]|uniref:Universal stress protein n=1 Tax=Cohnella pontilimi TaxID=2564100 RepID=A0A4U0F8J7_9BACL|nr:universal stress protein [Cohnella pontilimi]TJY40768.1 universal stress protein [Cohnella pontilimi]
MSMQTILLAYDGSDMSKRAAAVAGELAGRMASKVETVHVLELPRPVLTVETPVTVPPQLESEFREAGKAIMEEGHRLVGSTADGGANLLQGPPGAAIVSRAEQIGCDLIVIGHRGLSGFERFFLGSVSEYVLRHAPCPVLVVKE